MKNYTIINAFVLGLSLILGNAWADTRDGHEHQGADVEVKQEDAVTDEKVDEPTSEAVEVGNKLCPVSGEPVEEMGVPFKLEHNGKIYNLCCPMCVKEFKADPEKYRKIAEDEAKAGQEEGVESQMGMEGHDHSGHDQEQGERARE